MLKRIKIQGFKSLADVEVNLEFLSVLIGPNASGKSNFLDALHLLSRIATSRTLREAFAPPYRGKPLESFTFGKGGVASLLEREKVSFRMEVDVQLSPSVIASVNQQIQAMNGTPAPKKNVGSPLPLVREKNLRYCIEVEMLPAQGILRVADESLVALTTKGKRKRNRKPFIERVGERVHLRMEGQPRPLCYERYLDYSILSLQYPPCHFPHVVAMQRELASWFMYYFEPRERMRLPNPDRQVHHLGAMGENLAALLKTLRELDEAQFNHLETALNYVIPSITGIEVGVNMRGDVELHLLEGEQLVPASVVSEGTLRILGMLLLKGIKEHATLVGVEEPENGIYLRRVRTIAKYFEARRLLGDTQFIVTTQSPMLSDRVPIESLFIFHKIDGNTAIEPLETRLKSIWPKLDIREALKHADELLISERILRGDLHV